MNRNRTREIRDKSRNMNRKGIRNIRGFGGLGLGSEVKDGTGLNTMQQY